MIGRLLRLAAGALLLSTAAGSAYAQISPQPLDWSQLALIGIDGQPLSPETFAGKTVLVVNTASRCGFTPQYEGLQALWERYRDRGLVVLAVPANDFGGQEPGSNEEIAGFCQKRFQVSFPMTEKAHVVGQDQHPIFAWAERVSGGRSTPQWNFYKLLIAPDGRLDAWYTSMTTPLSPALVERIEALLSP